MLSNDESIIRPGVYGDIPVGIRSYSVHIYVKYHWLLMSQLYEVYEFQMYDRLHGRCLPFFLSV